MSSTDADSQLSPEWPGAALSLEIFGANVTERALRDVLVEILSMAEDHGLHGFGGKLTAYLDPGEFEEVFIDRAQKARAKNRMFTLPTGAPDIDCRVEGCCPSGDDEPLCGACLESFKLIDPQNVVAGPHGPMLILGKTGEIINSYNTVELTGYNASELRRKDLSFLINDEKEASLLLSQLLLIRAGRALTIPTVIAIQRADSTPGYVQILITTNRYGLGIVYMKASTHETWLAAKAATFDYMSTWQEKFTGIVSDVPGGAASISSEM